MTLFVGGPYDGQHRHYPPDQHYVGVLSAPALGIRFYQEPLSECVLRASQYYRQNFGGVDLFVHDSLTERELFQRLASNYKPGA